MLKKFLKAQKAKIWFGVKIIKHQQQQNFVFWWFWVFCVGLVNILLSEVYGQGKSFYVLTVPRKI